MKNKTYRLQIELTKQEELEYRKLCEELGIKTNRNFFDISKTLIEFIKNQKSKGRNFGGFRMLENGGVEYTVLEIPGLKYK
jgi:hypothetical protein